MRSLFLISVIKNFIRVAFIAIVVFSIVRCGDNKGNDTEGDKASKAQAGGNDSTSDDTSSLLQKNLTYVEVLKNTRSTIDEIPRDLENVAVSVKSSFGYVREVVILIDARDLVREVLKQLSRTIPANTGESSDSATQLQNKNASLETAISNATKNLSRAYTYVSSAHDSLLSAVGSVSETVVLGSSCQILQSTEQSLRAL